MFFQVNVTPKEKKTESSRVDVKPIKDFHITLAPFQPQTRISMETPVNSQIECFLHVNNTGNRSLNVNVTKRPPPERNVDLSFTNAMIEANSEITLGITWSPAEAGSWREVLQLTDGRRVKYEIPLVMQAPDLRKKDQKSRRAARKPLIQKSNTTQQSYPSKNVMIHQKEDCQLKTFDKNPLQSRIKRTRIDSYLDEPDKENIAKVNENFNELTIMNEMKKQRKEFLNATAIISTDDFALTPVKFNKENTQITQISQTNNVKFSMAKQSKEYNFSPQESFVIMEERIEMKTLRRETYVKTPKYRDMITIEEHDESTEVFDDSLSPTIEEKFNFSGIIDNINFTPKDNVFELSPDCEKLSDSDSKANTTFEIVEMNDEKIILPPSPIRKPSTFLKPTRLANNFEALTPIQPAPKRKVEFASSSLLSMDCSNFAETPRRCGNTSYRDLDTSTVKDILEADMWVKPEHIVPVRREKRKENLNDTFELDPKTVLEISPPKKCSISKSCTLEISPPKSRFSRQLSPRKRIAKRISPTKSGKIVKNHETSVKKKQLSNSFKTYKTYKNPIPGVKIANLSLSGISRKKLNQSLSILKETSVKLHDPNDFVTKFCNPDPFAATMTEDPFLSSTLYYDEKWVHHQEIEFKKWLNTLMTPPEHLNADIDSNLVDIGKVWQSSRMQEECVLAESKESISARIHTDSRLNTLRKAAFMMFRNPEVSNILSRTTVCVEKGILVVRQDRDLHRDIGLQKGILELFLSYNPLWLRIGLETVYGETIPLRSNNDLIGLTRFLLNRFFSDQFIVKQHSHPTVVGMKLATFTQSMNKFMLKKFLLLVFFLDFAKSNKLIGHDPCLFHKKAPHKESRSILLSFSREVLSGIGDITKVLKAYGYIVSYKQTYLDEFDYAVKDMSSDLRDGVRLCRAMELITGNRNLTCQCRVPSISRLQKIHNVNIALKALLDSGYTLTGEIDAKSISDGHREKTLSLLWQIIYKFQKPRFEKAARTLQNWWRSKLWYVRVKNLLRNRKIMAACCIQRSWRCYKARKILGQLRIEHRMEMKIKKEAIKTIQNYWLVRLEGKRQRNHFLVMRKSALKIQNWWRRCRETREYVRDLEEKKAAVVLIQKKWRSYKKMERQRSDYLRLRSACLTIQCLYRAKLSGRKERETWQTVKKSTLVIQRRYRALKAMQREREQYIKILETATKIQKWWRSILLVKKDHNAFLLKKYAVRILEKKWLEKKYISPERQEFLDKKRSVAIIKNCWQRYRQTKVYVRGLQTRRRSIILLQTWWRTLVALRSYRRKRTSVIKIQNWYRSLKVAKQLQSEYGEKKAAILILQKNWRMTIAKRNYWQMKSSVLIIEEWYENILLTRSVRTAYLEKKRKVQLIESWWLGNKKRDEERRNYLQLKEKVLWIQEQWRGKRLMTAVREVYERKKSSTILIQSYFRMWRQRKIFEELVKKERKAIIIQKYWRRFSARKHYQKLRETVILVQKLRRQKVASEKIRRDYLQLRKTTIYLQRLVREKRRENRKKLLEACLCIQKHWRSRKIGEKVRREYETKRKCIILLQSIWRMRRAKRTYESKLETIVRIQRQWRSKLQTRRLRKEYETTKQATILIQRRYRETKLSRATREEFLLYRRSVIKIQSIWRMKIATRNYRKLISTICTIQLHRRSKIETRKCRENYQRLRTATITIQRFYRAWKMSKIQRSKFLTTRDSILRIQQKWRATIFAKKIRHDFLRQKTASVLIQTWWRSLEKMQTTRNLYLRTRTTIVKLQRRYRANVQGRIERENYLQLRRRIIVLQNCWRSVLAERREREIEARRRCAVEIIENWWLSVGEMRKIYQAEREERRRLNCAARKIQALWRGYCVRRKNTARMSELRIRTENAAKQAIPAETLANRLEDSINVFLFSNDLGRLSMCLSSLDVITRLSPNGCITVCKVGLVDRIYMTLVRSNRSVPWMDACTRATSILVTLAKYPPTKPYILKEDYIETLTRFLTVTVEKEVPLFLHLSTLIWVLIEDPDYAEAILSDSRSIWLLNSVYSTITKKKPKTPQPSSKIKDEVMPNSKPDWGLRQKQPRLFVNALHAITSILRRLNEHKENRE
ncbi:abnormal spindle-like microcephaly-associated protein homolog [Leptopilina heterotoma]|uniref:abnormal spindle-like microcephaly-associated protein homolog n=1 Tax=Leptopilina heterotoma TaxID=63436 RepID=UPI001CAA3617|nr:abnormal spindle-like microcephaly-associated protein homolog [Leptopilina heterotoma]